MYRDSASIDSDFYIFCRVSADFRYNIQDILLKWMIRLVIICDWISARYTAGQESTMLSGTV